MNKDEILKYIATKSYNMCFGAKIHFSTYDIVTKVPNGISLFTLIIAILSLTINLFGTKAFSSIVVILSIFQLYILFYNDRIDLYAKAGDVLTQCFDDMHKIYNKIKACDNTEFNDNYKDWEEKIKSIEEKYKDARIAKQIWFSNIYAHYKIFGQMAHNLDWMNEYIKFSFWKDKLPASIKLAIKALLLVIVLTICFILFNIAECPIKKFLLYLIHYC